LSSLLKRKGNCVVGFFLLLFVFAVIDAQAGEKRPGAVLLAIVPFQSVEPDAEGGDSVKSPLSGAIYFGSKILKGQEAVVEEIFTAVMKRIERLEIIERDRVAGIYRRLSAESLKAPLLEILKKTGVESGADFLAVGHVFRYVERIGYDYSVEKPASVAFEISFIRLSDGKIIWRGVFDKTQKSLMEDLFQISSFFRSGGKWLSAYELTRQGMEEVLKTFVGFDNP